MFNVRFGASLQQNTPNLCDGHMKNPLFKEIPFEKEVDSKGGKKSR